jgi:hypothetical protein
VQKQPITAELCDKIEGAAIKGGWTLTEVSLLTPNLQLTELARDASYLVIDNAYSMTIIQLDMTGRPIAVLERE